ncbi:16S rRNA (uracil(1498)-N(3))-methyltransferase, partial [Rhodospirillum rubrum]
PMIAQPPRHRLYVDAPLAAGLDVRLDGAQAHYLRDVMRLGPGAAVALFNGRDGEWLATLDTLGKAGAQAVAQTLLRPQGDEDGPWLLFAPLKKEATDYLVEKAVELGCGALLPVMTRRTQSQKVRTDRLRAQVIGAAEQCERLTLPAVFEPRPLAKVLEDWPAERRLFVLAERRDALPAARAFAGARALKAALLVGPEGGLDDKDLDALLALPSSTPVGLGPRILRAETAAAAALAVWQAVAGDWETR